jgi:hypothetical protein
MMATTATTANSHAITMAGRHAAGGDGAFERASELHVLPRGTVGSGLRQH